MNIDKKTGLVHEWTVICRSSSIDKESGALSIFNVADNIKVNKKHFEEHISKDGEKERPFIIPAEFEIISMWSKSNPDFLSLEVKTEVFDPFSESLFRFSYNVSLKEGRQKSRNRSKIKGFKVTGAGLYTVNLSVRKDEGEEYRSIARTAIDVALSEPKEGGSKVS